MKKETTHDLVDFMHSITNEMQSEYERIQKHSTEDPATAGDQGEENWANIFKDWLPPSLQVVTKGRIMNEKGETSPQVDILILKPFYPKKLLNKKYYMSSGVIAAFECKNTLKAADIEKCFLNSTKIRRLINQKDGHHLIEINSPIIYGLLAHSHIWKQENSKPIENIKNKIIEFDKKYAEHPRECLDILCVSDLALWSSYKMPVTTKFIKPRPINLLQPSSVYGLTWRGNVKKDSITERSLTPIGGMLTRLMKKLSFQDKNLTQWAEFFRQTGIHGGVKLEEYRVWPSDTLSQFAQNNLKRISINKFDWLLDA